MSKEFLNRLVQRFSTFDFFLPPSDKFKPHRIYYLLAAFDVVTILFSLLLTHQITQIYINSVKVNEQWAKRLGSFSELSRLAQEVNSPGNDVFDSHQVNLEKIRKESALKEFDFYLTGIKQDFNQQMDADYRDLLQSKLIKINDAMQAMVKEADLIFSFFEKKDPSSAGSRMATMDRKFADVNKAIALLSQDVRDIQSRHFVKQLQTVDRLKRFELLVVVFIVAIVTAVTIYGHYLSRMIAQNQAQRDLAQRTMERSIKELRAQKEKSETLRIMAQRASQTKSDFLANMSHEIRTPINAVVGFSDLLMNTSLTDQQRDYLLSITESGKVLLELINEILDLSKIEAGHIKLESIDFSLGYLLESVSKIVKSRVNPQVALVFFPADDIPDHFLGDPTRIRQIVINLLSNAAKFTEKGEITLSVKAEPVYSLNSKINDDLWQLEISVKDTGIGIPEDKQKEVFNPFTQADNSTTRKYGGTGLGLTISQRLAKLMGGEILLHSQAGVGSEFVVHLKLKKSSVPLHKEIYPFKLSDLKGKQVVILDDHDRNRQILEYYCSQVQMQVVLSESLAPRVFAWLEKQPLLPDVILSDVMMPKMDGYTFASQLKSNSRYSSIKLIAVTSDVAPGSAQRASDAGFQGYLAKPILKNDLFNVLLTVMGDFRQKGAIITKHVSQEISLKGKKILIVEDNPINMDLMMEMLKIFGCDFDSSMNGQDALDKINRGDKYDLILMDLHMPVMGGLEATRLIRQSGRSQLPIIALTAAAMKEDEANAKQAGMSDFLTKPINSQRLKEKMMYWLTQSTASGGSNG